MFTFDGSPLCFPPQQPPPVDLVLLITAHHSKWYHLLFNSGVRGNLIPPLLHASGTIMLLATTVSMTVTNSHKYLLAPELEHDPHPDLLIDHSVLGILIKFLLRVHVDAVGSQFFSDLVREGSNIKPNQIHRSLRRIHSQIFSFRYNYADGYGCLQSRHTVDRIDYSGINANLSFNLLQRFELTY